MNELKQLSIIPKPVSIKYNDGVFQSTGLPVLSGDGNLQNEIEVATGQIQNDLERMSVSVSFDKSKPLSCKVVSNFSNPEAYRLNILPDGINIEAADPAGAYHALQTFRQLVLSNFIDGHLTLPCAVIEDYPRFSWRGFMLDCDCYFYSTLFIKRLIDLLSPHHISRFHWHLTDDQARRLPVAAYPLLTEIGGRRQDRRFPWASFTSSYYTEDDITAIVNYAAARHIEVIPEVDLPGHTSSVLAAYPGLGCTGGPYRVEDRFGIFEDVLCAGNDQIFDLSAKVFDALVKLFPSKWVHIGGDEVMFNRWEECPKCQKRLTSLGLKKYPELQSWITQRYVQMLTERGKIAIGWDEILDASDKFPLPKEAIVMSWRGAEGGIKASSQGHDVIMSPNTEGCYLDYKHIDDPEEIGRTLGISTVRQGYTMNPVTSEMSKEAASRILGGQCNLWSEVIYAGKITEYMIFPRLCAIAESVWSPQEKNFEDFSARLKVHQERLDKLGVNQYRGALQ
jgi:hexosaminidase